MSALRPYRSRVIAALALTAMGTMLAYAWQSASGEWDRSHRIGTFQLRSEVHLGDDRGQQLLQQMAQLHRDLESTLGLRGPALPIQVNLFQSHESFRDFLQSAIPQAADRLALYVDSEDGGQIYATYHEDYETDVRHECTHAVLHQLFSFIPLWMDEGLAEYFERPARERARENPYLDELKSLIAQEWAPDLTRLESLEHVSELSAEDYRECWGWMHFLLHGPPAARTQLQDYLRTLASGAPAGRLSSRLRSSMPDMEVQLINHLQNW